MRATNMLWLTAIVISKVLTVDAFYTTYFHCCSMGTSYATRMLNCIDIDVPTGSIGVKKHSICLLSAKSCCIRQLLNISCKDGISLAKKDLSCESAHTQFEANCCYACKLGMQVKHTLNDCQWNDELNATKNFAEAFTKCCSEERGRSPGKLEDPADCSTFVFTLVKTCSAEQQKYCDQICIPYGSFYRCECFAGYEWNATTSRCDLIASDADERCPILNQCEHICVRRKNDINCECYSGYRLSSDRHSCRDIDECFLNLDKCNPLTQDCINKRGSYQCIDKFPVNETVVSRKAYTLGTTFKILSSTIQSISNSQCPEGFAFNAKRLACDDIDECAVLVHDCDSESEQCRNTVGGYRCEPKCPKGFRYSQETNQCEDVDECVQNVQLCGSNMVCINHLGNYSCRSVECKRGYRADASGICQDVNECEQENLCAGAEICINEEGGFRCLVVNVSNQCPQGFVYNPTVRSCSDVDECFIGYPCPYDEQCVNTHGSFRCVCPNGFSRNKFTGSCDDINECALFGGICMESQRCDNTVGSYTCSRITGCGTGYTYNSELNTCEDDDECSHNTHTCHRMGPTWECENTLGSFVCKKKVCPPRYVLGENGSCRMLKCQPGFKAGFNSCIDINECAIPHSCRRHEICVNTPGSYECKINLKCSPGYQINEKDLECEDIDECVLQMSSCDPDQTCRNVPGRFYCICQQGYQMDENQHCKDIDECATYHPCSSNAECENTAGSYNCICKEGFKRVSHNHCTDIDECQQTSQLCQQKCTNNWGSYICSCETGYVLAPDKRSCVDVNECEEWIEKRELCMGSCHNQLGSYICSCPPGYRLEQDQRSCRDIDECIEVGCPGSEICFNIRGSFKCQQIVCPSGYRKDQRYLNRCIRSQPCYSTDVECLRKPMSYSYNFVTVTSQMHMPPGVRIELFKMRVPHQKNVEFTMRIEGVRAPNGTAPADGSFFFLEPRSSFNEAIIYLVKPVEGPQDVILELKMQVHTDESYAMTALSRVCIYVSRYSF